MARKGEPKTGGRVAGTPNKSTAAIKELGGQYGPAALAELARLATNADSEQARVAACKELLNRAYGKAPQYIEQKTEIVEEQVSDLELARRVAYLLTKH